VIEAECHLLSQIGTPIDRPRIVHLRVKYEEDVMPPDIETRVESVAEREIARIPELWKSFLAEVVPVA
jgi:S-adenosylmethionine synthetase